MAHYATVYEVYVHHRNKPKERFALGDLTQNLPYLGDFFERVFDPATLALVGKTGQRTVGCESRKFAGENNDELEVIFEPGEKDIAAVINKPDGTKGYDQTPDDTQVLRSASLFRLPREEETGWWACHVNNGRSFKTLVSTELRERFKETYPDEYMLKIEPCVNSAALEAAIEQDRLLSASLSKYERSPDTADAGEWVSHDTGLKLRLQIVPERGGKLNPARVIAAMKSKSLGDIVKFGGIDFDKAQFEVELDGGQRRTFKIEAPDSGHAFSALIEPELDVMRVPKDASLFQEVRKVLNELG